jgi:hypothetical protein
MRADILEAIKLREEPVKLAGSTLIVRELSSAADLGATKGDPDIFYRLMMACVFEEDGVTPAMTAEDIPALKAGSRKKLAPLVLAVQRVNGLDAEDDAKKSEAGQVSDSSTA